VDRPNAPGSARSAGVEWHAYECDAEPNSTKDAEETSSCLRRTRTRFFIACGFLPHGNPYVAPEKVFRRVPPDKLELPKVPDKHGPGGGGGKAGPAPAFGSGKASRTRGRTAAAGALPDYYAYTTIFMMPSRSVLESLEKSQVAKRRLWCHQRHGTISANPPSGRRLSIFEKTPVASAHHLRPALEGSRQGHASHRGNSWTATRARDSPGCRHPPAPTRKCPHGRQEHQAAAGRSARSGTSRVSFDSGSRRHAHRGRRTVGKKPVGGILGYSVRNERPLTPSGRREKGCHLDTTRLPTSDQLGTIRSMPTGQADEGPVKK